MHKDTESSKYNEAFTFLLIGNRQVDAIYVELPGLDLPNITINCSENVSEETKNTLILQLLLAYIDTISANTFNIPPEFQFLLDVFKAKVKYTLNSQTRKA